MKSKREQKNRTSSLRESEWMLRVQNRITEIALNASDEEIYPKVLESVLEITESRYGIFGHVDEGGNFVMPSFSPEVWPLHRIGEKTAVIPREDWDGAWGRALAEGTSILSNDPLRLPQGHRPIGRALCVPILCQGSSIGLLVVAGKEQEYLAEDRTTLERIASVLAPVLKARIQLDRERAERSRAEGILRKSEHRYRSIIENIRDIYYRTDAEGCLTDISPAGVSVLGYDSVKEVLGKPIVSFYADPADRTEFLNRLAERGAVSDYWLKLKRKDESLLDASANSYFHYDEQGNRVGVEGIIRDVTERKRFEEAIQESQEYLKTIFDTVQTGIMIVDAETHLILAVNPQAARMFGAPPDEIVGQSCHKLACRGSDCLCPVTDLGQIVYNVEQSLTTTTGNRLPVIKTVTPVVLRGRQCLLESFADIRQLKKMEQDLQRARDAAESANRAKSEFVANMSHEIRTPMNGIIGTIDLLVHQEEDGKKKGYLSMARSAAEGLMELLNRILDFSKIEAGKLVIEQESFPLRETLRRCLDVLRIGAEAKKLGLLMDVAPDVPDCVTGDSLHLSEILNNLVGNAVKFTGQGHVLVEVRVAGWEGDDAVVLEFRVEDTGPGIAPEKAVSIFESFTQEDGSTTRKFGGTGLGLTISRRLVEMMGGAIRVESKPGEGCRFVFTVTLGADRKQWAGAQADGAALRKKAETDRLKILVVEDDHFNRRVATAVLEGFGYDVSAVSDGTQAVQRLREERFDLVLMDLEMPEMDGYAATRIIREEEKRGGGRIPIIAVTAHAFESDRQKCFEAGMDEHLPKPLCHDTLMRAIGKLLPGRIQVPKACGMMCDLPVDDVHSAPAVPPRQADGNRCESTEPRGDESPFIEDAMLSIGLLRNALECGDGQVMTREAKRFRDRSTRERVTRVMKNVFRIELALRRGALDQCGPLIDRLEEDILSIEENGPASGGAAMAKQ